MINLNIGWRELFFVAAAILTVIAIVDYFLVKSDPQQVGFERPAVRPKDMTSMSRKGILLLPYFKSIPFLLMLVMSFGLTAGRSKPTCCGSDLTRK